MSWSKEQIPQIVEQFWQNGGANCPDDNGQIRFRLHKHLGGDYDLFGECVVCSKTKTFRRWDDPKRARFRSWTLPEAELVSDSVSNHGWAVCPVCGTLVEKSSVPALHSAGATLRCLRCGNSNQWMWTTATNRRATFVVHVSSRFSFRVTRRQGCNRSF